MRKTITFALLAAASLTAGAQYQVANSGFEQWEDVSYEKKNWIGITTTINGQEPLSWNSFLTAVGNVKSLGVSKSQLSSSDDVRPGSSGKKSAKLIDVNAIANIYAQGNMTTGQINMGSATASDAKGNYNFTKTDDSNYNQPFTGKPDAMHVWVKYVSSNSSFRAKANTILHTAGYYQDPEANDITATVVAKAETKEIAPSTEWQELTIPFNYVTADSIPAYALASFSTNAVPGKGTGSDYLLVDDLEYLYYHALTSVTYNGTTVTVPEGTTTVDLSSVAYDANIAPTFVKKGEGATIEVSKYDADKYQLTVTVKGNDFSANPESKTVYTLQFKEPAEVFTYTNSLLVNSEAVGTGTELTPSKEIYVEYSKSKDSYDFVLKDFTFMGAITIPEIRVADLERTEANGIITYKKTTTLDIPSLNMTGLPINVTATVDANNKMTATIGIMNNMIMVYFAPLLSVDPSTSLATDNTLGLTNVAITRTFKQGWNTYCMPFDCSLSSLGTGVKAQEFTSATDNALSFSALADDATLAANTPYLVYFPAETSVGTTAAPKYLSATIASYNPKAVTFGAFSFAGNYEADMNMDGLYGVATVDGAQKIMRGTASATLPATAAYFTYTGAAQASAFTLNLGGTVTGIEGIEANGNADAAPVYNLQGVRVSAGSLEGLPAGVYVKGGKKVLVK